MRREVSSCDVCLRETSPMPRVAVNFKAADVCSVECAQVWITEELKDYVIPMTTVVPIR